ncbi:hypothetical protein V2J09_011636, partial [Rumex salicifolius]
PPLLPPLRRRQSALILAASLFLRLSDFHTSSKRSRRALLQRRAMEKAIGRNRIYELSLSFIIVLWGLVFLFNMWNSHGDDYRGTDHGGRSQAPLVNTSTWNDATFHSSRVADSVARHEIRRVHAEFSCQSSGSNHAVDKHTEELREQQNEAGKEYTNVIFQSESQEASIGKPGSNINLGRRNDRMAHVVDLDFDDFKTKEINSKNKYVGVSVGSVILRVEPGGAKYNYVSSGKGAKVLDFNKECKGASHILVKDKDKYLRNPCSAEEKFVVMELSEETLVSTVQIANFEHYSSNLKEFEILGSLVYPTDSWVKLGSFTAENVKHAQMFPLPEPKSVRYLKLDLLSHYGSEFYCTLSSIEVYGVDAVEWMLEDLIASSDNPHPFGEVGYENKQFSRETLHHEDVNEGVVDHDSVQDLHPEESSAKSESTVDDVHDTVEKVNHQQVSRTPGDSVLKILMQKVRALDLNLSVLERYLEELNSRYRSIFIEFDEEIGAKDMMIERARLDIKSFLDSKDAITKDVEDLLSWKSQVSMQLDTIIRDNIILRSEVRKVQQKQMYMESKGILIFIISMVLGIISLIMLSMDMVLNICRSEKPGRFWSTQSSSRKMVTIKIMVIKFASQLVDS